MNFIKKWTAASGGHVSLFEENGIFAGLVLIFGVKLALEEPGLFEPIKKL
jgi:hypothetical protein